MKTGSQYKKTSGGIKSVGVIGSRTLPYTCSQQVGDEVENLIERKYHIGSGGAMGVDQYVIERLLRSGLSNCGTIYAAWKTYDSFPKTVQEMIRQFKEYGGHLLWGMAASNHPPALIKASLLLRNQRIVEASYGLVAFIDSNSRGSIFTIKKTASKREQTAERIKDVFAYRAEQGLYNGGTRPYGYDSLSSELVPHKQEKQIVQFIFKRFLETKSTTIVAQECNSAGYRNRSGALWDKRQIHKLLNHPVYSGKIRWNGILSQGIHQALVTEDTFQTAQVIFSERTYTRSVKRIKGLLRGFLVCAECHTLMTPNYTKKKNQKLYYYYRCVSSLNPKPGKPCKNYLKMDEANQTVLDTILEYASSQKLVQIRQEIEMRNGKIRQQIEGFQNEIQGLEKALELVQKKKEVYLDSLVTKTFSAQERRSINEKINEFSLQEKQFKSNIYKAQFSMDEIQDTIVSIDEFKQEMISLKVNYDEISDANLLAWITKNITQILYSKESLKIQFKLIDLLVG